MLFTKQNLSIFLRFPFLSPPLPLHPPAATLLLLHGGGPNPANGRQRVLDQTYGLFEIYGIGFLPLSPTALDGCLKLTLISAFIYFWRGTDIANILGQFHPQSWADLKMQSILNLSRSRRSLIWATQSSPGNLQSSKADSLRYITRFGKGCYPGQGHSTFFPETEPGLHDKKQLQHQTYNVKGWTEGAFDIKELLCSNCWCL